MSTQIILGMLSGFVQGLTSTVFRPLVLNALIKLLTEEDLEFWVRCP
eukprot:SAG31_NODE_26196_length_446_cov_1.250720_1_plen_46_part_10